MELNRVYATRLRLTSNSKSSTQFGYLNSLLCTACHVVAVRQDRAFKIKFEISTHLNAFAIQLIETRLFVSQLAYKMFSFL